MKKILSIDGGGIRGILPATILTEIERIAKKPISAMFDLVAGTSTGGMLALGLNAPDDKGLPRHSALSLKALYEEKGREIFQKSLWRQVSTLAGLLDTEYGHNFLEEILDEYLGESYLSDSLSKTLITSYDIGNREPFIFRSWENKFRNISMKDAGRATSAAPTYFEPAVLTISGDERTLIDGGVFLNNPALSAYLEAVRIFPEEKDFMLVSLGTGENTKPISYEEARSWGKIEWAVPIFDVIFDGLNDAIDYHLNQILGHNYYRIQSKALFPDFGMSLEAETEAQIEDIITEAGELARDKGSTILEICERIK